MNNSLLLSLKRIASTRVIQRRFFILPILAALTFLGGCVGAEILHLTGHAFQTSYYTKLLPAEGGVKIPAELDSVTAMTYFREFWREDGEGKCTYAGVIVPWERTWPKEVNNDDGSTTLLPPEPGVRAGYVALINKKSCKSSETQNILLVGDQATSGAFLSLGSDKRHFLDRGRAALTTDALTMKAEDQPQWLSQVILRLTQLAPTTPVAKEFLEKSQTHLIEILPAQSESILAVTQRASAHENAAQ